MNTLGKVRQTLRPGQEGTKGLVQRFGDDLVLVRYRYHPARQVRQTTVELVVDERSWIPPRDQIVLVKVSFEERGIQQDLRRHGARWNRALQRWETTLDVVQSLHLENRLDPPPKPP